MLALCPTLKLQRLWLICIPSLLNRIGNTEEISDLIIPFYFLWKAIRSGRYPTVAVGPQSLIGSTRPKPDPNYTLQTPLKELNIEAENGP